MKLNHFKLSAGDVEILEILWERGPLTLAQTHDAFQARGRTIAYTTVQTRLDRMTAKGLLERSTTHPAQFRPLLERSEATAQFFDLVEDFCGGNLFPLMLHLAKKRKLNAEEIAALKKILKEE